MALQIDRRELLDALKVVSRAASSNSVMPILSYVKVQSNDNSSVSLQASNLEQWVTVQIAGTTDKPLHLALPHNRLMPTLQQMAQERVVTIEQKGQDAVVLCDGATARIKGMPPQEFPPGPTEMPPVFAATAEQVLKAFSWCLPCAANDDVRPALCCLHLVSDNGAVRVAATDGYRLAVTHIDADVHKEFEVLLPRSAAEMALAMLRGYGDAAVTFFCGGKQSVNAGLAVDSVILLRTTTIEGKFPDILKVIPTEFTQEVTLEVGRFASGVKLAKIFAGDANTVSLKLDGYSLVIASRSSDGETKDVIPTVGMTAEGTEDFQIALNVGYLLDALKVISTPNCRLSYVRPERPIKLTPVGDDDTLCVIMPMLLGK